MRLRWLLATIPFAVALAVLHTWATNNFIYWKYRWFDTPMHVLGGVTIAVFLIALLGESSRPRLFMIMIATVFIGWEIIEYLIKLRQPAGYLLDTIHDLVNDGIGATFIFLIARETIWHSN